MSNFRCAQDLARSGHPGSEYPVDNTFNINSVVISGSVARFGETLIDPIRREGTSGFLPILSGNTQIEASRMGQDIVILGAAALSLSQELGLS